MSGFSYEYLLCFHTLAGNILVFHTFFGRPPIRHDEQVDVLDVLFQDLPPIVITNRFVITNGRPPPMLGLLKGVGIL